MIAYWVDSCIGLKGGGPRIIASKTLPTTIEITTSTAITKTEHQMVTFNIICYKLTNMNKAIEPWLFLFINLWFQ